MRKVGPRLQLRCLESSCATFSQADAGKTKRMAVVLRIYVYVMSTSHPLLTQHEGSGLLSLRNPVLLRSIASSRG